MRTNGPTDGGVSKLIVWLSLMITYSFFFTGSTFASCNNSVFTRGCCLFIVYMFWRSWLANFCHQCCVMILKCQFAQNLHANLWQSTDVYSLRFCRWECTHLHKKETCGRNLMQNMPKYIVLFLDGYCIWSHWISVLSTTSKDISCRGFSNVFVHMKAMYTTVSICNSYFCEFCGTKIVIKCFS